MRAFSYEPVAAASIGQVHRAETHEGRLLALKIQYPGVRKSIASDMANLALLMRTPGLVPAALDVSALLDRIQAQLEHETDYRAEARAATAYRARLGDDPVLSVPAVADEHCTDHIIATEFAPGLSIDRLAQPGTQAQRDHVASALSRLAVHEFFRMRLVQTDPNFGNYLFDAASGRIALIDFGATESVAPERVAQLREFGRALRADDLPRLAAAAAGAGFTAASDPHDQTRGVIAMMRMAGEPLRCDGAYDFGASDVFARSFEQGRAQFFGEGYARTPPPDLLFLQRKFAGTFMLCTPPARSGSAAEEDSCSSMRANWRDSATTWRLVRLTADIDGDNIVSTGENMQVTIRMIGNSRGVVLPKPLLAQAGLGDDGAAEMTVEDGAIVIRKAARPVRADWAEAAKALASQGDDELVMGEFSNELDAELAW